MMKKLLRTVSVVLTLALVFSIVTCAPFSVSAAETGSAAVAAADAENPFGELSGGKYTLESMTYQLSADFAAKGTIYIPSGVEAVIDLNGHTVDSGATSMRDFICNDGTLTINDSSSDNSGKLTGGYAERGGVVNNNDTLTINGGLFTDNVAKLEGGAVYNASGAALTVNGGKFTNNSTESYGGGAFVNFGTMTLTGGTISGNRAALDGGAIYNANGATLTMTGGTITGNLADENVNDDHEGRAGGIYNSDSATLQMYNNPVVKDNAKGNLWLRGNSKITVPSDRAFVSNAAIDVTADNMPRTVTQGAINDASQRKVFSFSSGSVKAKSDDYGEILPNITPNFYANSWESLKTSVSNASDGDVIALTADITNTGKEKSIHVSGKSITLDLQGHTVDVNRQNESQGDDYHFMYAENDAVLTVLDTFGGGVIKNGNATHGGAFDTDDNSNATLNLYNITLKNNKATDGGAIRNRANLNLDGVIIENNESSDDGGAIMIYDGADSCTIKNSIIRNNTSRSQAGAIDQTENITTTIENTFIENNTSSDMGGGIYQRKGTVNITGGAFVGNSTTDGGAVHAESGTTFNATDTIFSGNSATGGSGGAVTSHAVASLTGCIFTGNTTTQRGGGLYLGNGADSAALTNTVFKNNTANTGGGIYVYQGTTRVTDCTVTDNTANTVGGGIYTNDTLKVGGRTVITGNTGDKNVYLNENNTITYDGLTEGSKIGIATGTFDRFLVMGLASESDMDYFMLDTPASDDYELITSCVKFPLTTVYGMYVKRVNKVSVSSWTALQNGIKNADSYTTLFKLTQTLNANGESAMQIPSGKDIIIDLNGFDLNRGLTKQGSAGHVIQMKGSSNLTIRDSSADKKGKVTGGWAEHGGGINLESDSVCTIESGNISGNHAEYGGGIWNKGTLTVTGGSISNNIADEEGGGIYGQGTTALSNCSVTNNSAKYGGGIYFDKKPNDQTLTNVTVNNNSAVTKGAGIYLQTGTVTLTNGVLSNNTSGDGGAVYVTNNTTLNANGTTFSKNKSTEHSGGAIVSHGTVTLDSCTVDDNRALNNGGGIWSKGTLTLNSCTITNNKLTSGKGGGVCVLDGTLNLYGGTISKNLAVNHGSGIYFDKDADNFNIKGKIVANDNAGTNIYLPKDEKLNVTDKLETGSDINVSVEEYTATFTKGFPTYHPNEDPALYFSTENGSSVIPDSDGEAMVVESDWTLLLKMIQEADNNAVIKLDRDWTAIPGDLTITVSENKNITLDLNGHTIDAKEALDTSILDVKGTLTIKDTSENKDGKITGGSCNNGGALYIFASGTVNLQSGEISGNTAKTNGGAIYNNGKLNISGGTVTENSATYGGGIYNTGSAVTTVTGGTITGNMATENGAAFWNSATLHIEGGEISGNTSQVYGGGVYNRGTLNVTGGKITENKSIKEGGGIFVQTDGTLNVKYTPVIENNTAAIGSNILLTAGRKINLTGTLNSAAKLDVVTKDTSAPLTGGYSTYIGSASITYNGKTNLTEVKQNELYFKSSVTGTNINSWDELQTKINESTEGQVLVLQSNLDGTGKERLKVENKTVTIELNGYTIDRKRTSNTGNGQVFGVMGSSSLTISDAAGTGAITGGYSHDGGGIYIDKNATVTITGGSIQGNTADGDGGGIYNTGTLIMEGGSISFNKADDTGGGIYSTSSGTIKLNHALLTGNYSDDDDGGAMNLHLKDDSSYIKNSTITLNECGDNNGGGIRLDAIGKTLTIENTHIEDNVADESGGGIYITDGTIKLNNSYVNNNHSESGGGVYLEGQPFGIYLEGKTHLVAVGSEFCGNETSKNGGGIDCHGKITLTNCKINDNISDGKGGGIYHDTGDQITISGAQTEIKNNTSNGCGGGIYQESGKLTIEDFTISGNKCKKGDGGGIYLNEGVGKETFIARNITFSENEGGTDKDHNAIFDGGAFFLNKGTAKVYDCTFTGNWCRSDGGAIGVDSDTKLYVYDSTFTENKAIDRGSAIFMKDDGEAHLNNVTITGNKKTQNAVYADEDLYISGKIVIADNEGNCDLYLDNEEPLVLEDKLTSDSRIGVKLAFKTGDFTKKFNNYHEGEDPSTYFFANEEGCSVQKNKKGEGKICSTDWIDLQRTIDDTTTGTITLTKNYTADDTDKTLVVSSGKNITLDLNGFTLDGAGEIGTVLRNNGTLTIKDSTDIEDPSLSEEENDNRPVGTITGATDSAIGNHGTMTFESGKIADNTAKDYGGGIDNRETLTVTGGRIFSNTTTYGGGIYNGKNAVLYLYGGRIKDNTATSGGGIFCADNSTLRVKNAPYVFGNTAAAGKNILLGNGVAVTVDAKLADTAKLDLATKNYNNALTSGFGASGTAQSVFSYNENNNITLTLKNNELYFPDIFPEVNEWVNSWEELQNAVNKDENQGKIIGLNTDLGSNGQQRIVVDNKNVTIELAGHTMDRALSSKTNQGNVFKVTGNSAELTIMDTVESGIIRGGYADGDGGGFYVVDHAKLTINGGSVLGNKASSDGAGIYVDNAELVMTGGSVSGNKSSDNGGGIYTTGSAKITLTNATVINNISENGGGGLNIHLKENATFKDCLISSNISEDSDGAGLSMDASGKTLTLDNTAIINNTADDEGGGVYLDAGTIEMTGGKIDGNTAKDGGGVYITGSDHFNMSGNAAVSNNETTEKSGGGITCHGYLSINGASVSNNHSAKYGGGIYYQNSGKTITLTNATVSGNEADNDGGGLYIKQGTVKLSGGEISSNTSPDGGGVFVTDDTDFEATGTTFDKNTAEKEDGGAIVNKGETKLSGVTVTNNIAHNGGGGIWNNDTLEIADSTFTGNNSKGYGSSDGVNVENGNGGAISHVDGNLTLTGTNTITDNTASIYGAGIYVDNEANNIYIQDKLIVNENNGSNVYLDDEKLTIKEKLTDGALIAVTFKAKETEVGVITKDFSKKNKDELPSAYFLSDDGHEVYLEDDEAALKYIAEEENPFVSRYDNIQDPAKATGKNWMASISGERYLYEINLPRAHDASMNRVDSEMDSAKADNYANAVGITGLIVGVSLFAITCAFIPGLNVFAGCALITTSVLLTCAGVAGFAAAYKFEAKCTANAKTQYRYLDEQMEDGVREFDMRLNPSKTGTGKKRDDGQNLWLCHGKSDLAGSYFGCDHEGDRMTLNQFLDWAKEFLKNHPTEIIEFTTTVETTNVGRDTDTVNDRLKRILKDLSREINPSTGKPYLYMEDGVFNKQYDLPKLKDCRGQILVARLNKDSQFPSFSWGSNIAKYGEAQGSDITLPEPKISQIKDGVNANPSPMILTDALTHRSFYSGYFFNTTDDEMKLLDTRAPLDLEEEVYYGARDGSFEGLFLEGGEFNQHGKYVGRMGMDGVTRKEARMSYSSNFYPDIQYRTITVKSGIDGDETVKKYMVLKGTKLTIPDCIYDNPSAKGYFKDWKVESGDNGDRTPDYAIQPDNARKEWLEEHTYFESLEGAIIPDANSTVYVKPNDVLCVMDDITVTAEWGNDINTPVEIVWKDGNNADNLRPDKLQLSFMNNGIDEAQQILVTSEGWKGTLTGDIQSNTIKPDWDMVEVSDEYPNGNEVTGYRYEVSGELAKGFTVTMYHTPQTNVTVAGTITWDDMDNHYQRRPESVELTLYKNGEEQSKQTVEGNAYSFGIFAQYEDYEEVVYTVEETPIDYYSIQFDGFNVTNIYNKPTNYDVAVEMLWKDSGNAEETRPESVTLILKNGDDVVDSKTVKTNPNSDTAMVVFNTEKYEEDNIGEEFNYTVVQEGLPETYTAEIHFEEIINSWIVTNTLITPNNYFKGHSLSLNGDIGVNFFIDLTPEELETANVNFKWFNKELNVKVTEDMYDAGRQLYKVECPVAAAEMTYNITANLSINGEIAEKNIYSVARYADSILTDLDFRDSFIAGLKAKYGEEYKAEEKYAQLIGLILSMLDYGAKAQLAFDRNTDNLANGGYPNPYAKDVKSKDIDSESSDMSKGLENCGLEYQYSTVVFLSKTSLRHYYKITDEEAFNAIKDGITFDGESAKPVVRGDMIYFEKKSIAASQLDTQYILKIGDNEYQYSVMDYTKRLLDSDNDKTFIDLAKATYNFSQAANDYFNFED